MNKQNIILMIFGILIAILFYLFYKNKKESFEGIAGSSFVSRVPKGTIVAYYPPDGQITSIPSGWTACDGKTDFGKGKVPDLRGRFIRMYSGDLDGSSDESSYVTKDIGLNVPQAELNGYGREDGQHISYIQKLQLGDYGGTDLQKMHIWEMPSHNHGNSVTGVCNGNCPGGDNTNFGTNQSIINSGGNQSHNNTPPYYVLVYIIKL